MWDWVKELPLWAQAVIAFSVGLLGYGARWYFSEERGLKLAHEHRLRELMTDKLHQYTVGCYLRLYSAAGAFSSVLGDAADPKVSLFLLARFHATRMEVSKEMPGWFLERIAAEEVLFELETRIRQYTLSGSYSLRESELSRLVKATTPYGLLVDFEDKLRDPTLWGLSEKYAQWLTQGGFRTRLQRSLTTYCNLIKWELDSTYEHWYKWRGNRPWYYPWWKWGKRPYALDLGSIMEVQDILISKVNSGDLESTTARAYIQDLCEGQDKTHKYQLRGFVNSIPGR